MVLEENDENYSHSKRLHVFINELLEKSNVSPKDLSAISVSKGPGSYTGLRIGVSSAKGLCFALEIPLISIDTLDAFAHQIEISDGFIIPLIDARRMEVYSSRSWASTKIDITIITVETKNNQNEIILRNPEAISLAPI